MSSANFAQIVINIKYLLFGYWRKRSFLVLQLDFLSLINPKAVGQFLLTGSYPTDSLFLWDRTVAELPSLTDCYHFRCQRDQKVAARLIQTDCHRIVSLFLTSLMAAESLIRILVTLSPIDRCQSVSQLLKKAVEMGNQLDWDQSVSLFLMKVVETENLIGQCFVVQMILIGWRTLKIQSVLPDLCSREVLFLKINSTICTDTLIIYNVIT